MHLKESYNRIEDNYESKSATIFLTRLKVDQQLKTN